MCTSIISNRKKTIVGMPTCWPFDARRDPSGEGENIKHYTFGDAS